MSSNSHAGRPASWVAVAVIMVGFVLGGFGLPMGNWVLFWAGVGVVVVGGLFALFVDIMSDVVLEEQHK